MEIKQEVIEGSSLPTETHRLASLSTINQIANKLASNKALQIPIEQNQNGSSNGQSLLKTSNQSTINEISNQMSINGTEPHPVVSKMTEALSLKQSPTLTKQLTQPVSGSSNKVQVITQYMCRYCGQQFDSSTVMQHHIEDHVQGKTPHQCSVCGKEYRTPSKLQRHVRVHSGERPYPCSVCGRRFTRSDHVKQHMKVHFQPKDLNICHLCNDMKFNRRQALHLHLQQQHLIQQVFTCHRCGEAYESLEEMQTHKLTHDSVLNSMQDSQIPNDVPNGVAKFALGPQKADQVMNKYDIIKPDKPVTEKPILPDLKNGFYIPANLDNVSALSNKLILEGMEKMAKEAAEAEVQKKYHDELMKLNEDAKKYQQQNMEVDQTQELYEQAKIAACFNIKVENVAGDMGAGNEGSSYKSMDEKMDETETGVESFNQTTTMMSADGMSMFILPTTNMEGNDNNSEDKSYSDIEEDAANESDQNSTKESAGINREGDQSAGDDKDEEKMNDNVEGSKPKEESPNKNGWGIVKEEKISPRQKVEGYSRPCPKSKKPGYVPPSVIPVDNKTGEESQAAKPAYSLISPKLNELIKAKCEQNMNQSQQPTTTTVLVGGTSPFMMTQQQSTPKVAFLPPQTQSSRNQSSQPLTFGSLQSIFLPVNSGVLSSSPATVASTAPVIKAKKDQMPKLLRCEHCCIWFEDNAMSLLHNTLHAADEADPFTCRKCYKKLGNRLEFMAHLVWHLEPNMDI